MIASRMTFTDDYFTNSSAHLGGAVLAAANSVIKMYNITVENNSAEYGGGMAVLDSLLEVVENAVFENNRASYGGGLYVYNTNFHGNAIFMRNSVTEGGGGIYASRSTIFLKDNTTIIANNSAMDGGGLLLSEGSKFLQQQGVAIHLISNSARSTGGAIRVEENNLPTYCILRPSIAGNFDVSNSDCFFQIQSKMGQQTQLVYSFHEFTELIDSLNVSHMMYFGNNSAVEAGTDVYGGSVDSCTLNNIEIAAFYSSSRAISGYLFDVITSSENKATISSDPLRICTCGTNLTDCTGYYNSRSVYPGGTVEIPVIAHGQRNGRTGAVIHVIETSNIRINELEYFQNIDSGCNTLKYTIQSRAIGSNQEIILYAQALVHLLRLTHLLLP